MVAFRSRRSFLAMVGCSTISQLVPTRILAQDLGQGACSVAAKELKPAPQIAVSLNSLAKELQFCGHKSGEPFSRTHCASARVLFRMTRLDGLTIDTRNRDIILWGLAEKKAPRLYFDDFVIALRAAFEKYLQMENGKQVRYQPAISLDADGKVFEKLNDIPIATKKDQEEYRNICAAPMVVRVDGMPRHTRLAKSLVAADYKMKLVGFGEVVLPIDSPFPAKFEAHAHQDAYNHFHGLPGRPDFVSNRMWFEAGDFTYQGTPGRDTYFLNRTQVVLKDRTTRTDATGNLVDGGNDEAFSRAFTCAWTERMEEIYGAEPIWRDMHNIYRHFAIANIISKEGVFEQANFDPRFLLEDYAPSTVSLPDTMPGFARFLEVSENTRKQYYSICGGVSVGVESVLVRSDDRLEPHLTDLVSGTRPPRGGASWRVVR